MRKESYDLVTVVKFDGISFKDKMNINWTFLGYSVVEKKENGKGICFSNKKLEYHYLSSEIENDYCDMNIGDIRIKSVPVDSKLWINATSGIGYLRKFIENSNLPFVDDSMFASKIEEPVQKVLIPSDKK